MSSQRPRRHRHTASRLVRAGLVIAVAFGTGCGNDLGECNEAAANQLVYSTAGLVATKGQALMHDSCGQGAFCHSSAALGSARQGVQLGLNFDVLPNPKSLRKILDLRERIWKQIDDGLMPPDSFTPGNSHWSFDVERRPDAPELPSLATEEGRGALRNWLACGAPSVTASTVPVWAKPPQEDTAAEQQAWHARRWTRLHAQLQAGCMRGGCHDGSTDVDASPIGELAPLPFSGGECAVYRWLLYNRDSCGERLVFGGDPDKSALLHKVEDDAPACGGKMPPTGSRNAGLVELVRDWIAQGAWAPQCGEWSERAPRLAGLDAGVGAPAEPPRWTELYSQVIAPNCVTGCHEARSASTSGELDLSDACGAWRALKRSGPCGERVVSGERSASSLYRKVSTRTPGCGGPMPPTAQLRHDDMEAIGLWIEAGALAETCE